MPFETEKDLGRAARRAGGSPIYLVKTPAKSSNKNRNENKNTQQQPPRKRVSPWTGVPLGLRGAVVNMVCEVPRGTSAKYEVTVDERPRHPIRRDLTKDGKPRSYPTPMPWNYGMMPRTWEDPAEVVRLPMTGPEDDKPFLDAPGDGDPLDVVEVGDYGILSGRKRALGVGEVCRVRALGALALIDGGELDWKVVAIREDDPLVSSGRIKSAADLEREMPGTVDRVRQWFVDYKPGSGNRYAFGGRLMPALSVIRGAHAAFMKRNHGRGNP
jgi:inorganic pyrophosphatase